MGAYIENLYLADLPDHFFTGSYMQSYKYAVFCKTFDLYFYLIEVLY